MEIRQLEYFLAVVDEANFTRAADRVHVSQSGVSAQIRRLERELGQTLLDRSERVVRTTAAGAAILPYARAAVAAVAGTRQTADELAGLTRGHVSVGMVTACSITGLFDGLAGFHAEHPGIDITLSEDDSDRLVEGVQTGRLDVALAGIAGPLPQGLAAFTVADERLVAAVRPDDPWASRRSVTLADLAERALVCLTVGAGVRAAFDGACDAAGIRANIAFEASAPTVVADLARRGLGVAVVSETMATAPGDLRSIAIRGRAIRSRLDLIWRAEGPISPAARVLVDHARRSLAPRP